MPETELQLIKLDMEYTKKAVEKLDQKVDDGFESAARELAKLGDSFNEWKEKQEELLINLNNKRTEDIMTLVRDFDKKLEQKPDRKESWGESAIKWFLVALGALIIGYAFKVIITAGTFLGIKL